MTIESKSPDISAVICTRNRGQNVCSTVESILSNTHNNFEVILIDQSSNQETCEAIQPYISDPLFQYIHSDTVGTGRSRNIGLRMARGKVVAYADDDVTVSPQWLEELELVFTANDRVAFVFCQVLPAPFDDQKGYIPDFIIKKSQIYTKMSDFFFSELGLGAGMAVLKEVITKIGGFDDNLGPGSFFHSGEDRDLAIRVILKGWWVYNAAQISVIHYGFRTFEDGKEHTKRDFLGLGAAYIKPVKCGYWRAIIMFLSSSLVQNWLEPIIRVVQFKKPRGFRKAYYFFYGVLKGMRTPVDRQTILYRFD